LAARKALFTAVVTLVTVELGLLQVVQYGAAPARAPSCAARVIAP
jgi:hypothetical protein